METGILEGVSERTVINVSWKHWLYKNCKEFKNMLFHTSARVLGNILGNLKKYLFEKYFFNSKYINSK